MPNFQSSDVNVNKLIQVWRIWTKEPLNNLGNRFILEVKYCCNNYVKQITAGRWLFQSIQLGKVSNGQIFQGLHSWFVNLLKDPVSLSLCHRDFILFFFLLSIQINLRTVKFDWLCLSKDFNNCRLTLTYCWNDYFSFLKARLFDCFFDKVNPCANVSFLDRLRHDNIIWTILLFLFLYVSLGHHQFTTENVIVELHWVFLKLCVINLLVLDIVALVSAKIDSEFTIFTYLLSILLEQSVVSF